MTFGANAVLAIIDSAPVFLGAIEDPAAIAEAVRQFGLSELTDAMKILRAAEGEARGLMLSAGAQRLGQLVAAGALHEGFVKASIEEAASNCLLIRDDGLKAVRAAIAAGIKLGKKQPRDLSAVRSNVPHVRREATALSRPRLAAVLEPSPSMLSAEDPAPSSAPPAASPAPPAAEGASDPSSQKGDTPDASAADGRGGAQKPPYAIESDEARNMRLAFFPLTDLGNVERFRERHRHLLKWCQALGWLAWDGKRWSRVGADSAVKMAEHDTVRAIQHEAAAVRDSGMKDDVAGGRDYVFAVLKDRTVLYSDKIAAWGRSSETANRLSALSKRGEPYFAIEVEDLDADKMKINVNNGTLTIDRRNGVDLDSDYISFRPHDPGDLITKLAPVDYDPDAVCPEYDRFLGRVQPIEAMRRFLHQWGGLSLTGDVSEQKLAFWYGKGGNGKSVLAEIWSAVAGDYSETVPIETFLDQGKARSAGQATPDLAILPGVRMLRTSEPEKGSKLAEALIKLATGGEPLQARHLMRDFFKFHPQFKLTMSGNYRPTVSGTDEGIWRRVRLIPFPISIPKEERDPHLPEKLRQETSGILNRLLDGLRDWCDRGLIEPDEVTKATAEYRSDSDPFGRFAATCIEAAPGERVQSSVLHGLYEAWCKTIGEKVWTTKGLAMAMKERGYQNKQSNVMWWLDIKLVRKRSDFVDAEGHPQTAAADSNRGQVDDEISI
jgi:putative DNA primase/helicase